MHGASEAEFTLLESCAKVAGDHYPESEHSQPIPVQM